MDMEVDVPLSTSPTLSPNDARAISVTTSMPPDPPTPVASASKPAWKPPTTLTSRPVYPDTYTSAEQLAGQVGKETDPGRMAIYLCLLDEKPHLHPSLVALHRHRLAVHGIPLPPNPESDHPSSGGRRALGMKGGSGTAVHAQVEHDDDDDDEITHADVPPVDMVAGSVPAFRMEVDDTDAQPQVEAEQEKEWLMWKFTDEEEARRKAYLPLA